MYYYHLLLLCITVVCRHAISTTGPSLRRDDCHTVTHVSVSCHSAPVKLPVDLSNLSIPLFFSRVISFKLSSIVVRLCYYSVRRHCSRRLAICTRAVHAEHAEVTWFVLCQPTALDRKVRLRSVRGIARKMA